MVDNGAGMEKEDLVQCIKRHATSKVISQEDLHQIKTFGFRGEALASIAAVADLEINSKTIGDKIGCKLISRPNQEVELTRQAMEFGTQVQVKNLFYNVPARKKFLKSDVTELRHITETVIKFAISHPEVAFSYYNNGVKVFEVKTSSLNQRIIEVLPNISEQSLMNLDLTVDGLKIWGCVGKPSIAKSVKNYQYVFLNRRMIISKNINHAVFSCFEHIIDKTNYPFFAIFIDVDFHTVDVNVHPQKNEVKFEDEKLVYNAVKKAVNNTLFNNNLTFELEIREKHIDEVYNTVYSDSENILVNNEVVNSLTGEVIDDFKYGGGGGNDKVGKRYLGSYPANNKLSNNPYTSERYAKIGISDDKGFYKDKAVVGNFQSAFDTLFSTPSINEESNKAKQVFERKFIVNNNPNFCLIHNKYIFLQVDDGSVIIDMHNAHERVIYERIIDKMASNYKQSQNLLFPEPLELNTLEIEAFLELKEELELLGYEFSLIGEKYFVKAQPLDLGVGEFSTSIKEIIDTYVEFSELRQTTKRDNLAASKACKSAIKTGYSASKEEINKLIVDLFNCKYPYTCPHGRPVLLTLTLKEIDTKFKRT